METCGRLFQQECERLSVTVTEAMDMTGTSGDVSVSNVTAARTWDPELRFPVPMENVTCSHVKRQNLAAEVYNSLRWGWCRANPQNAAVGQFRWIDGLQVHWEFVSKSKVEWLRKTPDGDLRPVHMHAYTHTTISTKHACTHEYTCRSTQNKPGAQESQGEWVLKDVLPLYNGNLILQYLNIFLPKWITKMETEHLKENNLI